MAFQTIKVGGKSYTYNDDKDKAARYFQVHPGLRDSLRKEGREKVYDDYEAKLRAAKEKLNNNLTGVKKNSGAAHALQVLYRQYVGLEGINFYRAAGIKDEAEEKVSPVEDAVDVSDTLLQADEEETLPEEEATGGEEVQTDLLDGGENTKRKGSSVTITRGGSANGGTGNLNVPNDANDMGSQLPGDTVDVPTKEDTNNSQAVKKVLRKRRGRASTIGLGRRSRNTNLSSQVINLLGA